MIKVSNRIGEFEYHENYFLEIVSELIDFAINEKEYELENLSVIMIAEDVTSVVDEPHGVDEKGLVIIEEELNRLKLMNK